MADEAAQKAAIKKQVEYYFNDANFRRDKHLRGIADADPQGYVDVSALLTFNRLKALSSDPAVVAAALEDSDIVQLSADKKKLRRTKPLPLSDDSAERTVYMKGFPVDAKLDDLIEFANGIAPTARVSMRRFKDEVKTFKGSVFVEFAGKEGADKAVAAGASEEGLTFAGTKLEKVLKRGDYLAEKKAARAKVTETPAFKRELIPGVIVKLEGLDATASWSAIQEAARALAGVRFTEIDSATNTAHLRCLTPDDAAKVLAAVAKTAEAEKAAAGSADTTTPEGCLDIAKLGGKVPTATLLEGDEERAYWEKVWAAQAERFKANAAHRGGRKGGRKRPRDAAPPSADAAAAAAAAAAGTAASAEAPSAAKKPAVE